ncbi:hypothetical protein CJU89_5642 [Yarrowia sp. B02]|nr:hypothetical protein CJU89_5642 [Yarrowia sp. B02]
MNNENYDADTKARYTYPLNRPTANYGTMIQALRVPQTVVSFGSWNLKKLDFEQEPQSEHDFAGFDESFVEDSDSFDNEVSTSESASETVFESTVQEESPVSTNITFLDFPSRYDTPCFSQNQYIYPGNPYERHTYSTPSYLPKPDEKELIRKYDDPAPWKAQNSPGYLPSPVAGSREK